MRYSPPVELSDRERVELVSLTRSSVSVQTLWAWERGRAEPTGVNRERYAAVLAQMRKLLDHEKGDSTDVTGTAHNSPRQPNNVLAECRTALKLSHEKLAYLVRDKAREKSIQIGTLDSVTRHIKRIETGDVRDPSGVYKDLLCAVLKKTEAALFGTVSPQGRHEDTHRGSNGQTDHFQVRNNKLIPAFIGADLAEQVIDDLTMRATSIYSISCYHHPLSHPRSEVSADLWIWPFGVAIFRLVEVVEFPTLARYAVWHRRVYDEQMDWANQTIKSLLQSDAGAQYAMPINWITRSVWTRSQIGTALRILSAARILLQRMESKEYPLASYPGQLSTSPSRRTGHSPNQRYSPTRVWFKQRGPTATGYEAK